MLRHVGIGAREQHPAAASSARPTSTPSGRSRPTRRRRAPRACAAPRGRSPRPARRRAGTRSPRRVSSGRSQRALLLVGAVRDHRRARPSSMPMRNTWSGTSKLAASCVEHDLLGERRRRARRTRVATPIAAQPSSAAAGLPLARAVERRVAVDVAAEDGGDVGPGRRRARRARSRSSHARHSRAERAASAVSAKSIGDRHATAASSATRGRAARLTSFTSEAVRSRSDTTGWEP